MDDKEIEELYQQAMIDAAEIEQLCEMYQDQLDEDLAAGWKIIGKTNEYIVLQDYCGSMRVIGAPYINEAFKE